MADWVIKKVEDCFVFIKNGANIRQEKNAGGLPITRIETLSGGIFNRDRLGYANIFSLGKYASYILESGDLLFSHINSKAYIGRTVMYEREGNEIIIHGMNLLRMKVDASIVISKFIFYFFNSEFFRNKVASYRKDAVNQSSISISDLKKIEIHIPPLNMQQRIVAELDLLSGIIEKKNAQLKTLDELAQSIFYEMFGDPRENELKWNSKAFKDVFKLKSGDGLKEKDFIPGKYPVFGGNGISGYHNAYNKNGEHIIIGRVGAYCGNVRYVNNDFWLTDNAFDAFFNTSEFDYQFVSWLLNILDLHRFANHAAQPVISNAGLRELSIIIPPIGLQTDFANKISAIEHTKKLVTASLETTRQLLDSRMDKYFNV